MNRPKPHSSKANYYGLYIWAACIAAALTFYLLAPDFFSPQRVRGFFLANLDMGLTLYFIISTLRGFTLIPSTPLVLGGILIFPPVELFLVNQLAVYTSSAVVYFMAGYFRSHHFFEERYPSQVEKLARMLHRRELIVISTWGFLPFVPSDMIVYVCSVLRMSIWKTLFGIGIGEGVICATYIFGGAAMLEALMA